MQILNLYIRTMRAATDQYCAELVVVEMMDIRRGQSMGTWTIEKGYRNELTKLIRVAGSMSRQIIHSIPRFDHPYPSNATSYGGQ